MRRVHRRYCYFLDDRKYSRAWGCKAHDNSYGWLGGGSEADRRAADRALLDHMRSQGDPAAWPAFVFVRLFGWAYYNYHDRPWRGQLLRRVWKNMGGGG